MNLKPKFSSITIECLVPEETPEESQPIAKDPWGTELAV